MSLKGDTMEAKILQRDKLLELIDEIIERYEVIAPTDEMSYGEIESSADIHLTNEKPVRSIKEFFFPEREVLFEYETTGEGISLAPPAPAIERPRVIFGTRPCDAAGLPVLDKLISWDYMDPFYFERRENTVIMSVACDQPCKSCFCTSVGGSPAGTEGSDLLLTPMGDVYHVQIITKQGEELVEEYQEYFQESDQAKNRERARLEDEYRDRLSKNVDVEALRATLDFDSDVWESVTPQCIDCAVCTFLCPVCHCFDIQDEGDPGGGCRVRCWDSCAFPYFTKMPVGQPRPTHYRRYRQRIMHKFQYYPENFGRTLCVGCGRCVQHCPVGIDITEVLKTVDSGQKAR